MTHIPKSATTEQIRLYSNHKLYFCVELLVTAIFSIVFHLILAEVSQDPSVTIAIPVIIGFCIIFFAFLKRRNRTAESLKEGKSEVKFSS